MIFKRRFPGWSRIDWLKHLAVAWNWTMVGEDKVRIGPYEIEVNPYYFELLWREWRAWKHWYLPPWPLKNKTILDVGAGCGETALFYYHHGARKVIAVEPEPSIQRLLRKNMIANGWKMEVLSTPFELSMLNLDFDFMKMDAEGCETELLKVEAIPPCAIEVHDRTTAHDLELRFKMRNLPQKSNWILQSFGQERVGSAVEM